MKILHNLETWVAGASYSFFETYKILIILENKTVLNFLGKKLMGKY